MTKASNEWELVEIEFRVRAKDGGASKLDASQSKVQSPGGSSDGNSKDGDGSRRKNGHHSRAPIVCHGCGESGHILRYCKKSERRGGAGGRGKG